MSYPKDREAGIDLFRSLLDVSEEDFRYEEGKGFEEYIYGDEEEEEDE